MLGGLAAFAVGIWIAFLAPAVGTPLVFGGLVLAQWFRFPADWEKTWPDDFPRLAHLSGREPHPERWEPTPSWWWAAPPRKRLEAALAITAASLALIVWTIADPDAVYGGYMTLLVAPLGLIFGVFEAVRAIPRA